MNIVLAYGIEFAIQTVLILAGLWIMIAVQKLNNNILGLIGTAALTSALEMILDRYVGVYLSTTVVIVVLEICIWKVTGSSNPFDIDVQFTVFVGAAVTFALNMFLIGALMGDLRPSANEESNEVIAEMMEKEEEEDRRSVALPPTNQVAVVKSNAVSASPAKSPVVAKPAAPKLSEATLKSISLKGLSLSSARPSAVLSDGKRTFTLEVGESRSLPTPDGTVTVKCERLAENTAVISLNGEPVTLTIW